MECRWKEAESYEKKCASTAALPRTAEGCSAFASACEGGNNPPFDQLLRRNAPGLSRKNSALLVRHDPGPNQRRLHPIRRCSEEARCHGKTDRNPEPAYLDVLACASEGVQQRTTQLSQGGRARVSLSYRKIPRQKSRRLFLDNRFEWASP